MFNRPCSSSSHPASLVRTAAAWFRSCSSAASPPTLRFAPVHVRAEGSARCGMGEAAALRGRLDACLTATLEHRRARLATAAPPSGMPRGSGGEDGTPASEVPVPAQAMAIGKDAHMTHEGRNDG